MLTASCAMRSEVPQTEVEDLRGNLKYNCVSVKKLEAGPGLAPIDEAHGYTYDMYLNLTRNRIITYLNGKNLFAQVQESENMADYACPGRTVTVEGTLTDMRIVSGAARIWGGAFAGRSYMKMDVWLVDDATGEVVAQRQLEGAPSAMGAAWSAGDSDRKLPVRMGELIGDFVMANAAE
jgi:hypothetical protein